MNPKNQVLRIFPLIEQVQNAVCEQEYSESLFYSKYKKFAQTYQELIDKGLASKRESQLPSIIEKMAIMNGVATSFNRKL